MLMVIALAVIVFMLLQAYRRPFPSPAPTPAARRLIQLKPGEILLPLAARPIPAYTRIQPNDITLVPFPKAKLANSDAIQDAVQIVGRVPRVDIPAGSPVDENMLLPLIGGGETPWIHLSPGWVANPLERSNVDGAIEDLRVGDEVVLYDSSGNRISERAVVLVRYKPHPDSVSTPGSAGSITVAQPAQEAVTLEKVLANHERVRLVAVDTSKNVPAAPANDK